MSQIPFSITFHSIRQLIRKNPESSLIFPGQTPTTRTWHKASYTHSIGDGTAELSAWINTIIIARMCTSTLIFHSNLSLSLMDDRALSLSHSNRLSHLWSCPGLPSSLRLWRLNWDKQHSTDHRTTTSSMIIVELLKVNANFNSPHLVDNCYSNRSKQFLFFFSPWRISINSIFSSYLNDVEIDS